MLTRLIACPEGPEMYSTGMGGYPASFQPIQISRRHPPPLAQRERSTSAPNVCFNMVAQSGVDTALDDWSYRLKVHNLAGTGKLAPSLINLLVPSVLTLIWALGK